MDNIIYVTMMKQMNSNEWSHVQGWDKQLRTLAIIVAIKFYKKILEHFFVVSDSQQESKNCHGWFVNEEMLHPSNIPHLVTVHTITGVRISVNEIYLLYRN